MKHYQPEPFRLFHMGDGTQGHSVVIPLPRGRALRVGWSWRGWCKVGPRRYRVVATQTFVQSYARLVGAAEGTPMSLAEAIVQLKESGVEIEGVPTTAGNSDAP